MSRVRLQIYYSGRVQGVGFRYTVKSLAPGYELSGVVRNLADGRVELTVEGEKSELEAFHLAVRESGLQRFIEQEQMTWSPAQGGFRGFEIVR